MCRHGLSAAQYGRTVRDAQVEALLDAANDEEFSATCDHLPWVRLDGHCQCGWLRARAEQIAEGS